jgi:aspartate/methionine/tyrosine aminotransferase
MDDLGPIPDLADPRAYARFSAAVGERYGVSADQVIPALGTSGALWVVMASLVAHGGEVLVEDPAYEPLYRAAEGLGARVRRFRREPSEGFRLDTGRVIEALTPSTRAVVVSSPHNPTGILASDEAIARLAGELAARGVILVVDEVYRELCAPKTTAHRLGKSVIALSSLTKCFGIGWARAGWILAPPELTSKMSSATLHAAGELPRMSGALGAHAFTQMDRLLARARSISEGNRERIEAFAVKHAAELRFHPPAPGVVYGLFEDLRGRDLRPIIEQGAERESVLVVPGEFFGMPSAFRMSWTISHELLDEALVRLERALGLTVA